MRTLSRNIGEYSNTSGGTVTINGKTYSSWQQIADKMKPVVPSTYPNATGDFGQYMGLCKTTAQMRHGSSQAGINYYVTCVEAKAQEIFNANLTGGTVSTDVPSGYVEPTQPNQTTTNINLGSGIGVLPIVKPNIKGKPKVDVPIVDSTKKNYTPYILVGGVVAVGLVGFLLFRK